MEPNDDLRVTEVQGLPLDTSSVFVLVKTSNGLEGIGECYSPKSTSAARWIAHLINEQIRPLLLGKDPRQLDQIWHLLYTSFTSRHGDKGVQMHAISGVDIALWDVLGKLYGVPVSVLLGGVFRTEIPLYASIGGTSTRAEADILADAERWVAEGFTNIKLRTHWGVHRRDVSPAADLAMVTAVRKRLHGVSLAFDANNGYSRSVALVQGRRLEELGLVLFEEPLRHDDYDGFAQLADALDIAIAAGEQEYTRWNFATLILRGKVDIVQPDVTKCGGISEMRRIAELAGVLGARFLPHCNHSTVGLAACLHVIASRWHGEQAYEFVGREERLERAFTSPLRIENGKCRLPELPGLGLEVDRTALQALVMP